MAEAQAQRIAAERQRLQQVMRSFERTEIVDSKRLGWNSINGVSWKRRFEAKFRSLNNPQMVSFLRREQDERLYAEHNELRDSIVQLALEQACTDELMNVLGQGGNVHGRDLYDTVVNHVLSDNKTPDQVQRLLDLLQYAGNTTRKSDTDDKKIVDIFNEGVNIFQWFEEKQINMSQMMGMLFVCLIGDTKVHLKAHQQFESEEWNFLTAYQKLEQLLKPQGLTYQSPASIGCVGHCVDCFTSGTNDVFFNRMTGLVVRQLLTLRPCKPPPALRHRKITGGSYLG